MSSRLREISVQKDQLVNQMTGQLTTNNWDVLCCYNETKINQLLSEKYKKGKLVTAVPFQGKYHDDIFGADVDIDGNLQLKEPLLNFIMGERYLCKLTMPIEGGNYTMTIEGGTSKSFTIPSEVVQLVCQVSMAAICGDTQKIDEAGKVIDFDSGSTSKSVFLHFQNNEQTIFDITPMQNQDEAAKKINLYANPQIKPVVIEIIKEYFKSCVSQIEYSLGGLTTNQPSGQVTLLPKYFIFSASKPDPTKDGSLNLYIQTTNSGNPPGDLTPNFQPGGTATLPIPDGYTATIILSSDLVAKILSSQFASLQWQASQQAAPEGINLSLKKNQNIRIPGIHTKGRDQCNSQDVNINFNSQPFDFNLLKQNLHVTWNFSQDVNWTEDIIDQTGGYIHDAGTIEVSATVDKSFNLASTPQQLLNFSFTISQDDIKVSTKTISSIWPGFLSGENIFKDPILSKVPSAVGTISFNLQSISVFVVSSLLFPEQNIFNIDSQEGFHVPRDLIIFGNIHSLE